MSKSTLYKYFDSKDDVVVTLVGDLYGRTDEQLEALDVDGPPSALEALGDVVQILADHADRVPTAIMLEAPALPGGSEQRIDRTRVHLCGCLEEAMARGLDNGEFEIVDARLAASAFLAAAEEAVAVTAHHLPDLSQGDAVQAVLDMMTRGIARA